MVKSYVKIIMKSRYKDKLLQLVDDIASDNLRSYDLKKLSGKNNLYRVRIGDVRCVFVRDPKGNRIIKINSR